MSIKSNEEKAIKEKKMMEKAVAKKVKQEKKGDRKRGFKGGIVSLILAIALFGGLLAAESSLLNQYEKTTIVSAKAEIEEGLVITSSNLDTYFALTEVPISIKTETSLTDISKLNGMLFTSDVSVGEFISTNDYIKKSSVLTGITDGLRVSIKVADFSQAVAGTIRQGDLINLIGTKISSEKVVETITFENVYVDGVFDANGIEIEKTKKNTPAVVLSIIIDTSMEEEFNTLASFNTIRASKIKNVSEDLVTTISRSTPEAEKEEDIVDTNNEIAPEAEQGESLESSEPISGNAVEETPE